MRLSIIIPVYNVEQYLSRCIDSCINQDLSSSDYEIIIVNDGSTDGSKAIAERYVENFNNIKLINQKNCGLSGARNNGLKVAIGEYVWFIDSDDWIEENCIVCIVKKMETLNLDMLQIGFMEAFDDGVIVKSERGFFEGCKSGCDVIKEQYIPAPAQFTIYKREFLTDYALDFFPGIYHEDAEFKPRALFFAKRFASLNKNVYYYYQRSSGNIMSCYNLKRGCDILTVCNRLYKFEDDFSMIPEVRREFNYIITVYLNEFFRGVELLTKEDKTKLINSFRKSRNLRKAMRNSKHIAHRFAGWLLTISITLGLYIIKKNR